MDSELNSLEPTFSRLHTTGASTEPTKTFLRTFVQESRLPQPERMVAINSKTLREIAFLPVVHEYAYSRPIEIEINR